jgi:hypothetical protein
MRYNKPTGRNPHFANCANVARSCGTAKLLLPGALFMAVLAELLAPFMFVNLRFATFFQ